MPVNGRKDTATPTCPALMHHPLCICTVGLPARGKTYTAMRVSRYLNWIGVSTRVFNVGNYRRQEVGAQQCADFFDPLNKEGMDRRRACAMKALEDMGKFLNQDSGQAAVFDATNSTRDRRQLVIDYCKMSSIKLMFLELICDNVEIVDENIKEVKISSPDYVGFDPDAAIEDFKERIRKYTTAYEPLDPSLDRELSWLKVFNVDERYEANKIKGHLQSKLVYYMMNIHTRPRSIYLTRHGESELNVTGKIGGNSNLSEQGRKYAVALKEFFEKEPIKDMQVWTSHMKRTIQTAAHLNVAVEQWHALNEIDAGECESMSYEDIQTKYPKEFAYRDQDKFHYRYPRGESYQDLVHRLEPVTMELERQKNVLVICHQAVMRCILAYFLDKTTNELPYIHCPLHTVMKLTPQAYGCKVEKFDLEVPAVDTYRPKPKVVALKRSDSEALQNIPEHL